MNDYKIIIDLAISYIDIEKGNKQDEAGEGRYDYK